MVGRVTKMDYLIRRSISKSMSDQLWTECDIDYLGTKVEILID